jgi:large repetitive protein
MTLTGADLGILGDLAKALGLLDAGGDFNGDWMSAPGDHLKHVLADDAQRQGLVNFVHDALGGSDPITDPAGLVWLPAFERAEAGHPSVKVYVVLDQAPADHVRIGAGVSVSAHDDTAALKAHVPLFRAAKSGHAGVADPVVLGTPDGVIDLDVELTIGDPTINAAALTASVPTSGEPPTFGLTLKGLKLPGAPAPSDLTLSLSNLADLEHAFTQLVLGLVKAQVDAIAGAGPVAALAALLGLRAGSAVPELPVHAVLQHGVSALTSWFEQIISGDATRAVWLAELATLLGGTADTEAVAFALGSAQLSVGVRAATGTAGHPTVTPFIAVSVGPPGESALAQATADLAVIDLGAGTAKALPSCALTASLGTQPSGAGTPLLTGDPAVDRFVIGFALDPDRKPTLHLAAEHVTIGGHVHDVIDLSSPGAVADAAGTIVSDVADSLLGQLGPAVDAVKTMLGITAPTGFPAVPTLDLAHFLRDPLGSVTGYWQTLVDQHPDAVPAVLTTLRDLVADASKSGVAISGTGTETDPWRIPIVGTSELHAWKADGQLTIAANASFVVVDLGQRCTRLEANLTAALTSLDLTNHRATFLPLVSASLAARGRVADAALVELGPISFRADQVGLDATWRPAHGLNIGLLAPNLTFSVSGTDLPIAIPTIAADGTVTLDDAGWDTIEGLLGALAAAAPVELIGNVARALGWQLRPPGATVTGPHLRLAALKTDAQTAIRDWLGRLAIEEAGELVRLLRPLARALTGSTGDWGSLSASGTTTDPWQIGLDQASAAPTLVGWVEPDGPDKPVLELPVALQRWRSGSAALSFDLLAEVVQSEGETSPLLKALAYGRDDLAAGLEALVTRWDGSDGRVIPPPTDPAGVTVQTLDGVAYDALSDGLDLPTILGRAPTTVVYVSVGPHQWSTDPPPDRLIHLDTPGLAPEAFAALTPATGHWFVVLAPRADAKLATGDPDGIAGQAQRLQRVLNPLAQVDNAIAVVATAEAGHAAVSAANAVAEVTDVVTLGTPWSPITMSVIDVAPAAEAVRFLSALDATVPDPQNIVTETGSDLARGRSLLAALTAGIPLDDPVRELRPPAADPGPFRANLIVHAIFGVLPTTLIRQGITALVVDGLQRISESTDAASFTEPAALRTGVRLPLAVPAAAGLTIGGHITLELEGAEPGGADAIKLSADRAVQVHLELSRINGWLVGGPDPARVPGSRHDIDLRWLEADVTVPIAGSSTRATASIVLHEPRVFGLSKPRWVVKTTGAALAADEATPALPEVRVLLSSLSEALSAAAAAGPTIASARAALTAAGLFDTAGGSVPDAIDHLLHDPVSFASTVMTDATRRGALVTALRALTTGTAGSAPDRLTWTVGPSTIALDLSTRRATVDVAGTGAVPWTLHAAIDPTNPDARLTLGSTGTTPVGGGRITIETQPHLTVTGEIASPGGSSTAIPLWPNPDPAALLRLAAQLVPAELARISLEYLRRLDDTVRPVADAALDAFGLLAQAPAQDGLKPVRLPLGLLTDPLAWLTHPGALGAASGGLDPAKAIAVLDALRPILGITGDPGAWNIATGVTVKADSNGGHVRLGIELDSSALAPIGPNDQRLTAAITASLTIPHNQPPQPGFEASLGLATAAPGRRAVHIAIDGGLKVFIRPDTGADIPLYPNPPGLGQLAQAAAHALPLVLNAIAAETGGDAKGTAGAVVRAIGDAMGLRTGAPPTFHDAELQAWAGDPAGSLAGRLPALEAAALNTIATALGPMLPPGLNAAVAGNELQVTFNSMTVGLTTSPFGVHFVVAPANVPGLQHARLEVAVNASGLTNLDVQLGPAALDVGDATLRPSFRAIVGAAPPGGRRVELGLALDDAGTKAVGARWLLGGAFGLISTDGATEHTEPETVALAILDAVVDLAGSVVVGTTAFSDLMARSCGAATVGAILDGVLVHKPAAAWKPLDDLFDVTKLLGRLQQLALNLVRIAQPKLDLAELSLALVESPPNVLGVQLIPKDRYQLGGDDVTVSLEFDASWIEETPVPQPGLLLRLLHVGAGNALTFQAGIEVDGIGFRVARASGALLEVGGVSLGSIGLHLYGLLGVGTGIAGGVQLQLSDLAVGTAGAGGGNQVAQGVMKDAGSGETKLAPKFSPAVAVQKPPGSDVLVSLRAGDPPGPWWLAIQKGFGPVYVEQVGFDAKVQQHQLQSISLLIDGRVAIFGLTAAVDELSLTFVVASNASMFDPSRWAVDLAGFAIASDLGGITLEGGLRKFTAPGPPGQPDTVQYIGMLLARFAAYGLSAFGGYGLGRAADGETFASFFAFGAVNGPIGGPPAFFLTGIGGGLGINRGLVFPQDLSQFGTFPFIQALDPGATPPSDPMAVLDQYKDTFPIKQGEVWFAAGISFNSFALVDGVAVVAISVGDGFELALLGLARMALPRPQVALVSIELGLICRFSTREGVLWIQAQLTDNSWLLFPEVRLTGGFAFVSWFKGPNSGQFVLTIGGYHPSFHRDGYPIVPRLGFHVDLFGAITIVGESYFALTSEALMAGGKLEASASLGPAWAHLVFGADGIVFFDPFWLDVRVYASVSAGVTIDVWIGTITISVSLGAEIHLTGPPFHGEATFDVGPVSLTVPFGDSGSEPQYIDYPTFVRKYLEQAPDGAAKALSAITGRGSLIPKPGAGGPKDVATADGSAAKPFIVISEFECSVTTTVPIVEVRADGGPTSRSNPSQALGLSPMGKPKMEPALRLRLVDSGGHDHLPDLLNEAGQPRILLELRNTGSFPVGVWGLPQSKDAKKVPAGDVITAVEGTRLDFHAKVEPGLPPVNYNQVETDKRRPLPFVRPQLRTGLMQDAAALAALVPAGANPYDLGEHVMGKSGNSKTAMAALRSDRAAPPRLGSLTEGLATDGLPLGPAPAPQPVTPPPIDYRVLAPRAIALLSSPVSLPDRLTAQTTVSDQPNTPRHPAPTLLSVQAATEIAVPATLRRVGVPGAAANNTVIANGAVPLTRVGRAPAAALRSRGAVLDGQQRLDALTASVQPGLSPRSQLFRASTAAGGALTVGEVAVLQLPNASRDADNGARPSLIVSGPAHVVVLAQAGAVLAEELNPAQLTIPSGSERIVVLALGDAEATTGTGLLSGWHAGQQLAAVGWNTALGSRCLVSSEGATMRPRRQRAEAGWVKGAELVRGTTTVSTRFVDRPHAVAIVLDQPVGVDAGQGLAMTLGGATRMTGPDTQPLPPTVVASGARSAVVYPIAPGDGPVTVTVASEAAWNLVGVFGGSDVAAVADTLAERGVDAAVRPIAAGGGRVSVSWSGEAPPPPPKPIPLPLPIPPTPAGRKVR